MPQKVKCRTTAHSASCRLIRGKPTLCENDRQQLKTFVFKSSPGLVHWPSRRVTQRNQLSRRILRGRQWRLGILRHDRQYLSTPDPLNGKALTLHRHHPVFFVKDFPLVNIHNALGCFYPTRRLQVKFQKNLSPGLDNQQECGAGRPAREKPEASSNDVKCFSLSPPSN